MATLERLEILLGWRSQVKQGAAADKRELSSLQSTVSGLKGAAGKDFGAIKDQVLGLNAGFGMVAKGAIAVGAAMVAIQAGKAAFEMGRASAQSMRLADSFQNLAKGAGSSAEQMLSAMRRASKGMIDDTSLIGAANRAMLLEVANTSTEMAQLLEIASVRGKAMGMTTQEAFGDLVTGIGRLSAPILDNLGIVVNAEAAYARYATTIGKTSATLTDAERKQALVNDVIRTSQGLLAGAADQGRDMAGSFERMDASLANAKDALGALFTPAAAIIAENLANAADALTRIAQEAAKSPLERTFEAQAEKLEGLRVTAVNLQAQLAKTPVGTPEWIELNNALSVVSGSIDSQTALVNVLGLAQGETATAGARLAQAMEAEAQAHLVAGNAAVDQTGKINALRQAIRDTIADTEAFNAVVAGAEASLRSSFLGVVGELGPDAALAGFQEAQGQLKALGELGEKFNFDQDKMAFMAQALVGRYQESNTELRKMDTTLAKAAREQERLATAAEREAEAAQRKAEAEFESFRSKVQGVLQGSLKSGIDLDEILPREDAIEEPARRLADIAIKGFESPWYEWFRTNRPDMFAMMFAGSDGDEGKIKEAAARMLRAFEDGLRPELIDKEAAKERVKRMLLGDANLAQMATEIAMELAAEFGGRFTLPEIAATIGVSFGDEDLEGQIARRLAGITEMQPELKLTPTIDMDVADIPELKLKPTVDMAGVEAQEATADFQLTPEVSLAMPDLTEQVAQFQADLSAQLLPTRLALTPTVDMTLPDLTGQIAQFQTDLNAQFALTSLTLTPAITVALPDPAQLVAQMPDGAITGETFRAGFIESISAAGTQAFDVLAQVMESRYTIIRTAGHATGSQWGGAFLETVGANVPPALVAILVRLVTPGVQALIQQYATMEGTVD